MGRHADTRPAEEHAQNRARGGHPDPGPDWMARGHGHTHGGHGGGEADRRGRTLLAGILIPFAVATVVGLVVLWPGHRHYPVPLQFQTAGGGPATFVTGEVLVSDREKCTGSTTRVCLISAVKLKDGATTRLEYPDGPGAPRLEPC